MAKTMYTMWDRAYQRALVHFWRKWRYKDIIDNLKSK